MDSFLFKPIGTVHSDLKHKLESPTQATKALGESAVIELLASFDFEQALEGLDEFERIWVIYQFHLNDTWKPMVNVPRKTDGKLGVLATRSPYRPNPIGMSCVRLEKIEGRKIHLIESDILDGSPVLDIKPYVDYCDSFETSYPEWLNEAEGEEHKIIAPEYILKQIDYLQNKTKLNFKQFIDTQLKYQPIKKDKKRVEIVSESENSVRAEIAFRTWRLSFELDRVKSSLVIMGIRSAYSRDELADLDEDPYNDKKYHRQFIAKYGY